MDEGRKLNYPKSVFMVEPVFIQMLAGLRWMDGAERQLVGARQI